MFALQKTHQIPEFSHLLFPPFPITNIHKLADLKTYIFKIVLVCGGGGCEHPLPIAHV